MSESEQITLQQKESETPPTYTQNLTKKHKHDFETSLIDFMNASIPSPIVPPVSEINPDRSFFESVLPSISNFTEDQKIEFRCEVLKIIQRMRNPPVTQNYEYSNIPYYKPTHVSGPLYPSPHHSNYLNRHQFPIHSQTRLTTSLSQPQSPTMNFNIISPSASSSTTMDQTYSEEDGIDIFRDGT